jgi:glycosyltransferase involved in cell wall biosynthesis
MILHRLSPKRRHAFFFPSILSALEAHETSCLVVAGDGPERSDLEFLVANSLARRQVRFLGRVSHEEVPRYLQAADIFLNPSYVEGFPRVVIEAMACGLPPLVTDAGGTADLLPQNLSQFVVSRDDPKAFASALGYLLSISNDDVWALGEMGRPSTHKSTPRRMLRVYTSTPFSQEERVGTRSLDTSAL